jgi:alkylation response protein AidB-like acyl-CoA dehydrogenase
MVGYSPPLDDIRFLLEHVFPFGAHAQRYGIDLDTATALAIAGEAGKFAARSIAPLNRVADTEGARWRDSTVTTAPGFAAAYREFCAGGWNAMKFPAAYGGQEMPKVVTALVEEMWQAASFSFALCPMLTAGAAEALLTAADERLRQRYLPRLVSGEWSGTMNLTEPQAGSDLAAIRTRAIPQPDGSYRISGEKIFITYGEHDLADNIIHLVLARTPGAPAGVKGISLFVVPKLLVGEDGMAGTRNDVRCGSIEHKLGIHGSPTAVMLFGENGGAVGDLVGQENHGLEYMFIMMNEARFSVGLQGLAIADRAYQHALSHAQERVQGQPVGEDRRNAPTILRHPDVRRLLLAAKSRIDAMRALAMRVAMLKEASHRAVTAEEREGARRQAELLTPVVKGWFTECGQRIASEMLQVFGGMGYVEETGAAQYYRDARIATLYEGTTAIQANDLLGRKTLRDGGASTFGLLDEIAHGALQLQSLANPAAAALASRLAAAVEQLRGVCTWLRGHAAADPRAAYAGSVPYLELWGVVCGGWMHAMRLDAAVRAGLPGRKVEAVAASAEFFAQHFLVEADALAATIRSGARSLLDFPDTEWRR